MLIKVSHALVNQFQMDLISLHHLLILRVRSYYLGELIQAHVFGATRAAHHPLVFRKHSGNLFIDFLVHVGDVKVSEANPELILVIEDD